MLRTLTRAIMRGVSAVRMAFIAFASSACGSLFPAPVPMQSVTYRASTDKPARCLLVLLPGRGDSDTDFEKHGFIQAIRQRSLSIDVISANATLGYYTHATVLERIEHDILDPVKQQYEQIWFGGVSMGGLGSLIVAQHHERELAGLILIAPFLGDEIIDEIEAARGLARWQPGEPIDPGDRFRLLWRWLKRATEHPETAPSIYLASGDQDRLAQGHRLLGAALPPGRRFRVRGGHDWDQWQQLWSDLLDHSDFATRCR